MTPPLAQLELFLPGKPLTRKEPHWGPRGVYPDKDTIAGMLEWERVWREAGSIFVRGPVVLEMYVRVQRPHTHLTTRGLLSSAGRKFAYPPTFDVSNCLKLVEDALKGKAMPDDSHIVGIHACKSWLGVGDEREPGTYLSLRTAYNTSRDA